MADKFRGKYRIPSARLQNWDYGWNASYFVTICTRLMVHHFGEIKEKKMQLSDVGKIVQNYWYEIIQHFPFVVLDAFVVMPNHVHGIIIINKSDNKNDDNNEQKPRDNVKTPNLGVSIETRISPTWDVQTPNLGVSAGTQLPPMVDAQTPNLGVSTPNPDENQPQGDVNKTTGGKKPKWKPGTLGVIINQYKRICTINARKIHPDFDWHPRFHDRIIRDAQQFQNTQNYIINNPANWDNDKYFNK